MERIKYQGDDDRRRILTEQTGRGLVLTAVENHLDGDFLVFSEAPLSKPAAPSKSDEIEQKIAALQAEVDTLKAKMA